MPVDQFGPGLTGTMRNVPDISFDGAVNSPDAVIQNVGYGGPLYTSGGGTSQSAPMATAMWALVLQACKTTPSCATAGGPYPYRLGDPKGYFYALYSGQPYGAFAPKGGQSYKSAFYDVLSAPTRWSATPRRSPATRPGPATTT